MDTGELLVKHDAVAGYMDAMTTPFRAADRTAIGVRRPGDLRTADDVLADLRHALNRPVATR
jgi:hypothetical protein